MRPHFPHEKETIELIAAQSRATAKLWPLLRGLGFSMEGGYWGLRRVGEVPNPQSEYYGNISIYHAGNELDLYFEVTIYDVDGVAVELDGVTVWLEKEEAEEIAYWDRIEIGYLLATLPEELIDPFLGAVSALSEALELPLRYQGEETTAEVLRQKFHAYCQELEEYGGAGSMTIHHFIDLHYHG